MSPHKSPDLSTDSTTDTRAISRRTVLAGGVGGIGVLTLAACGSSGGGTGETGDTVTQPAQTDPQSEPAAKNPPSTESGSTSTGAADGLAKLDSITVGEAVSAKIDGKPVIVARPTDSTAACFSAICTHQGCTVAPAGKQLHCPCHGSVYNAVTGAVISGPAPRALDKIQVKVEDGEVVPEG